MVIQNCSPGWWKNGPRGLNSVPFGDWRSETDLWRSETDLWRSETDLWRSLSVPLETQNEAPRDGKRTLGDEIRTSQRSLSDFQGSKFEPLYFQILGRREYWKQLPLNPNIAIFKLWFVMDRHGCWVTHARRLSMECGDPSPLARRILYW
jgi:hypothetical protein